MKINRNNFFKAYRFYFGRLTQDKVNGLTFLLDKFEVETRFTDIEYLAYMLATIKHECADTWKPIIERGNLSYFDKYEGDTRIGYRLGNTTLGDGYKFRGRGYVQITGRANYIKIAKDLNLPNLITNPDMALNPDIAYDIMVHGMLTGLFTGKKLSDYIDDFKTDYLNARRVINGTDRAELIRNYAVCFEEALTMV